MTSSATISQKLSFRRRIAWGGHLLRAVTHQHHRQLLPLLQKHIAHDAVVLDVGAQAGQFTKLFSRLAPNGHVYAFEPSGYARSILRPVMQWRGLSNVTLCPFGLGDMSTVETLHMPIKKSGSVSFGLPHMGACAGTSVMETVTVTTLDSFIERNKITRVDFIKVDIEGWEVRFLKGARKTLDQHHPVIFSEVNDVFLKRAGNSAQEMWDMLKSIGYHVLALGSDGASLAPLEAPLMHGDIWCVWSGASYSSRTP